MSGNYQLVIHCGETLTRDFTWTVSGTPVDLTGYTCVLTCRGEKYPTSQLVFSWSNATGELTLNNPVSRIHLQVPTGAINPLWGTGGYHLLDEGLPLARYVLGYYELTLTSSGGICTKLLQGRVLITPTVQ